MSNMCSSGWPKRLMESALRRPFGEELRPPGRQQNPNDYGSTFVRWRSENKMRGR